MFKGEKIEILHDLFIFEITTKGVDGFFELIEGFMMLSANSKSISKIIQAIFRHEIIQDSNDILANRFIHFSKNLSINTVSFIAIYLIIYGSINIGLFIGL